MCWRALFFVVALVICVSGDLFAPEVDALQDIYAQTGPWDQAYCGWGVPGDDPCRSALCDNNTWPGVYCTGASGDSATQHVYELNLSGYGMDGTLPESITQLSFLTCLFLSKNPELTVSLSTLVNGSLPLLNINMSSVNSIGGWPESFSGVPHLEILILSFNRMYAQIPVALCELSALTVLELSNMLLVGPIPSCLGRLSSLTWLDVAENVLTGEVSEELCGLASLRTLWLAANGLSGTIPPCFTNLTNLQQIMVTSNYFTGSLDFVWGLSQLAYIEASLNQFSGTLPPVIDLPQLVVLELSINNLEGQMPEFNTPLLQQINMDQNQLGGNFPRSLCSAENLVVMSFIGNPFTGSFPECLGSLINLEVVSFGGPSSMSGEFPKSLCQLTKLIQIQFVSINISGSIPSCITNNENLIVFALIDTQVSGPIPDELFTLPRLYFVDLSSNQLTGTIPSNVSAPLEQLLLPDNKLSGSIPVSITTLDAVTNIDFSNNQLTGSIPPWNIYNTSLLSLSLGGNDLTLIGDAKQLIVPLAWAITEQCKVLGGLSYVDMSGISLNGTELDAVLGAMTSGYALVNACGKISLPLEVLRVARMGLRGMSTYMLEILPNLVVFDISQNSMQGGLPSAYLPSLLVLLDASGNNFTGPLPEVFAYNLATSLKTIDLTDNPYLGAPSAGCSAYADGCLPSFVRANASSVTQLGVNSNGGCYSLTDTETQSAQILVDPSFHNYEQCVCNQGFYGNPQYVCKSVTSLCTNCSTNMMVSTHGTFPLVKAGFYPSPDMANITQFISCAPPLRLSYTYRNACNASTLQCSMGANFSLTCQGDPCSYGYQGRLCAQCIPHFYVSINSECVACPDVKQGSLIVVGVLAFGLIALVVFIILSYGLQELPPSASCYRGRIAGRYIFFFVVAAVAVTTTNVTAFWESAVVVFTLACAYSAMYLQKVHQQAELPHLPRFLQRRLFPLVIGLVKSQVIFLQTLSSIGGLTFIGGETNSLLQLFLLNNPAACYITELSDPRFQLLTIIGTPLSMAFVIVIFVLLRLLVLLQTSNYFRGPTSQRKFWFTATSFVRRAFMIVILYFNLVFFQMNAYVWSYFTCTPDSETPGDEDTLYNVAQPTLRCSEDGYWLYGGIGLAMYVAYLLVALAVVAGLSSVRRRLEDETVREFYGYFYESYKQRAWYYDGPMLGRRLLVSTLAAVLISNPQQQTFWLAAVLLLAQYMQNTLTPFRHRVVNLAETLSLSCSILVCISYGFSATTTKLYNLVNAITILATLSVYVLAGIAMCVGACLTYSTSCWQCCGRRGWEIMDYWLAESDEHELMTSTSGEANERTGLISGQTRTHFAVQAEMKVLVEAFDQGGASGVALRAAQSLPPGSEERELALLAVLKEAVTSGLRLRSNHADINS